MIIEELDALHVPYHWGGSGWEAFPLFKNSEIENITALVSTHL